MTSKCWFLLSLHASCSSMEAYDYREMHRSRVLNLQTSLKHGSAVP